MTDKEIQEMARTLCTDFAKNFCLDNCAFKAVNGTGCFYIDLCTELYRAGYRKADEVRKETAKEILQIIDLRAKDICFDTNEEQFAVSHTVDELKQAITDKYGVGG